MNTRAANAGDGWSERNLREFDGSPFDRIGNDWMLVTAGEGSDWNAMTASWGGLGVVWNTKAAFVFVRPTRHTFGYLERTDRFSLSFFDESSREALNYIGSHSGRDGDKAEGSGLSPIVFGDGSLSFAEAREVLVCRKLYAQDIDPAHFIDASLESHYPKKDYHRLYIAKIEHLRVRV
jgi:flavin reductase (DIM6/NTAB) family NADH-FMN oxidoreductase RutF